MSGKENQKKGKKKGSILEVTLQPSVTNTTSTNDSDDSPTEIDPVSPQKTLPGKTQPADVVSQSTLLPKSSEHEYM